jgi:hypothetical protein
MNNNRENTDVEYGEGLRQRQTAGLNKNKNNNDEDEDSNLNTKNKKNGDGEYSSQQKQPSSNQKQYYYDNTIPITAGGFGLWQRFYLLLFDLRTLIMFPIRLLFAVFNTITFFLSALYPTILWLFIIWFFWYLSIIYWPYLIEVILVVFIPILNVFILLFNLFFMIFIIILSILIMLWNIIVPFIGMLLYVVVNVVLTILADIFNIIGSVDWEPIISAIMNILTILVDIVMQILLVLIKVGQEILMIVSKIISVLMEVVLTAVKIILPIVIWIVQILFKVLEPILKVIAVFFGGITSMFGRMSTGRNLLSVSLTPQVFDTSKTPYRDYLKSDWETNKNSFNGNDQAEDHTAFIRKTLGLSNERDDYIHTLYNKYKEIVADDRLMNDNFHYDDLPESYPSFSSSPDLNSFNDFASTSYGRRILQSWSKLDSRAGLKFVDEEDEEAYKIPKDSEEIPESVLNDAAHTLAHTFYTTGRNMHADDMKLAQDIMSKVLSEYRRKDNLGMKTLLREFSRDYLDLHPKFEETLSSVRFGSSPEHPRDMHARFYEERRQEETLFMHATGRRLMTNENDWEEMRKNYQSQRKVEDAKALIAQEEAYKKYHTDRMKVATVIYGATSRSLKESFEIGVTPENVIKHWNDILDYFGYVDIKHVHDEFVKTYGDAAGFLVSFSSISEHPILKHFKKNDPSAIESPYYHDWAIEQKKLVEAKAQANQEGTGRKLMGVTQQNQDKNVAGNKESKESFGGFATLSTLNCFSSPKNPLCIPEIPPDFKFKIPQIKLSKKDKETLRSSIFECSPWKTTWCVICLDRFYNVWQEFRFLISTIPLINYPIATLTVLAPWTGIFFNWIFLVPKFKVGSLFQFVCFVYHLYDVFIVGVVIWIASKIIPFFWGGLILPTWYNIRAARITSDTTYVQQRRLRTVNKYLARMQRRGEIAGRIGAGIGTEASPSKRKTSRVGFNLKEIENGTPSVERYINTTNNNVVVHHHHHHHHHNNDNFEDSDSDEEIVQRCLSLDERKRQNQKELLRLHGYVHNSRFDEETRRNRIYEILKKFGETHFDLDERDHDPNHLNEVRRIIESHPIHDSLRLEYHEQASSSSNPTFASSSYSNPYTSSSSSIPLPSSSTSLNQPRNSKSSNFDNISMRIE